MLPALQATCAKLMNGFNGIDPKHKTVLDQLAVACKTHHGTPQLVFVCTHNSRRSLLAQARAAAAAEFYGLQIASYSGGTEATAFNANAVEALRQQGFVITRLSEDSNAHYELSVGNRKDPALEFFSKKYTDPVNPQQEFFAVMMCEDAMEKCPVVYGALARFPLPFTDPKIADGTPGEATAYLSTANAIGTAMLYLGHKLAAMPGA